MEEKIEELKNQNRVLLFLNVCLILLLFFARAQVNSLNKELDKCTRDRINEEFNRAMQNGTVLPNEFRWWNGHVEGSIKKSK